MSVIKSLTTGVNDAGNALNKIGNCRCSVTLFATKYDSSWENQTRTSPAKAGKVVAIFFYIYRVTTDKKNQRNTFQLERNERENIF